MEASRWPGGPWPLGPGAEWGRELIGRRHQPAPSPSLPVSASVLQPRWKWLPPRRALPSSVLFPNLTRASSREGSECELGAAPPSPGFWAARLPLHEQHIPRALRLCRCRPARARRCKVWLLSSQGHQPGWDRRGGQCMVPRGSPRHPPRPGSLVESCSHAVLVPQHPLGQVSQPPTVTPVHCASSKLSVHRDETVSMCGASQ